MVAVLLALGMLAVGASIVLLELRLSPVLSGSMRPGIQPGDLVVTAPIPIAELAPGDVISFFPPDSTEAVLHRLVSIEQREDGTWISTKGDANADVDPWGEIRLRGEGAWRLAGNVPFVGFVPIWSQGLRGPVLVFAGVLLAIMAVRGSRHARWSMHPQSGDGRLTRAGRRAAQAN
jgi:signal peptidase